MLRMIYRHAVHALLKSGQSTKDIAQQLGVTQLPIQRIAQEPPVEEADDSKARRRRAVGRPAIPDPVRAQLKDLIVTDPEVSPLEILSALRVARHTRGNAKGIKQERPGQRMIPKRLFERVQSLEELVTKLFGQFETAGATP
jgi:hypothetical protein